MEARINPNNTWVLVEKKMHAEKNPVTRRNLELVATHMRYEAAGDIENILTTLCPTPWYRMYFKGAFDREIGGSIERIRQLYHEAVYEPESYRLEHDLVRVIADEDAVYTEGMCRQAYPGRSLLKMGITVDDPHAYYLAEYYLAMVWPRDPETGLLTGEENWMDRDMFAGIADRKITLDEILPLAA